jgi:hypothetical protein
MYEIDNLPAIISLGNQGDNLATEIQIDCASWIADYPHGVFAVTFVPRGNRIVIGPVPNTMSSGVMTIPVTRLLTQYAGRGSLNIRMVEDEVEKRTVKIGTYTASTHLPVEGEMPDPISDWLTDAESRLSAIQDGEAAQAATANANAAAVNANASAAAANAATATMESTVNEAVETMEATVNEALSHSSDEIKAFQEWSTTTGNPAVFIPDAEEGKGSRIYPLVKIETPYQAGTGDPSPENVREIVGYDEVVISRTGRNYAVFTEDTVDCRNGSKVISGGKITSVVSGVLSSTGIYMIFPMYKFAEGNTYTLSVNKDFVATRIRVGQVDNLSDINGTSHYDFLNSMSDENVKQFTITSKTKPYLIVIFYNANAPVGTTYSMWDIQIEPGSTATPYEPYKGAIYTQELPETLYAGEVDFENGIITGTWKTADIVFSAAMTQYSNIVYGSMSKPLDAEIYGSSGVAADLLISEIAPIDDRPASTEPWDSANRIGKITARAGSNILWMGFQPGTTLEQMNAAVSGKKIGYKLAEPTETLFVPEKIYSFPLTNSRNTRNYLSSSAGTSVEWKWLKEAYRTTHCLWRETEQDNPVSFYAEPDTKIHVSEIEITPTQSGTGDPSPDNIRPIVSVDDIVVSRTGKNLIIPVQTIGFGSSLVVDGDDFVVTATGNNGNQGSYVVLACGRELIGKQVAIRVADWEASEGNAGRIMFRWMTSQTAPASGSIRILNNPSTSSITATIPDNAEGIYLGLLFYSNLDANKAGAHVRYKKPQIEIGSTATPYEPYSGISHTITLPETLYGGVVDLENGVLKKEWAYKEFDGTENWVLSGVQPQVDTMRFTVTLSDSILHHPNIPNGFITSSFTNQNNLSTDSEGASAQNQYFGIRVLRSRLITEDVAGYKAWLTAQHTAGTPVSVAYKLAEPTETPIDTLTLTALPNLNRYTPRQNVVASSSGELKIVYAKSPIRQADEVQALIDGLTGG